MSTDKPANTIGKNSEIKDTETLIQAAEKGIDAYLENALKNDRIDDQLYKSAKATTFQYLRDWLEDPRIGELSRYFKQGISDAIHKEKWEDLVNAYWKKMDFGTGGIRGLMANDKESIIKLKEEGLDAPIIKGPNTLNDLVLLITSAGVAKFGKERNFNKIGSSEEKDR